MRDRMAYPLLRPSSITPRHQVEWWTCGSWLPAQYMGLEILYTEQLRPDIKRVNTIDSHFPYQELEGGDVCSTSILAHRQAESLCENFQLSFPLCPIHHPWEAGCGGIGRNHQKTNSNPNPALLWPVTLAPLSLSYFVCEMATTISPSTSFIWIKSDSVWGLA